MRRCEGLQGFPDLGQSRRRALLGNQRSATAERRGADKPGALEQIAPGGIGRLRLHCIIGIGFLPVLLRHNAVQAEKVMPRA